MEIRHLISTKVSVHVSEANVFGTWIKLTVIPRWTFTDQTVPPPCPSKSRKRSDTATWSVKDRPLVKCDIVKFLSYEVKWEVSGGVAVVARFNGKSTCRRRLKKPLSYRRSKGEGCFLKKKKKRACPCMCAHGWLHAGKFQDPACLWSKGGDFSLEGQHTSLSMFFSFWNGIRILSVLVTALKCNTER